MMEPKSLASYLSEMETLLANAERYLELEELQRFLKETTDRAHYLEWLWLK